ncbi:MAG: PAS domain S-box protein [Thermodesulfovibrionales bacterium]|nr:PAS domain S-box protein [Thermodesulfovibrionales bacterium]
MQQIYDTYLSLFNNAEIGIFRTRVSDGKVIFCNEKMARMFGYKDAKEVIDTCFATEHYVESDARKSLLESLKKHGAVSNFEARFYKKDGSIIWVRSSLRLYEDKGWIEGIAEDITSFKSSEEELKLQNRLMQSIIKIQSTVLEKTEPSDIFQPILQEILDITGSEYGFIGSVLKNKEGIMFLRVYTFAGIKWNEVNKSFYERYFKGGFSDFYNLNTLYGEVLKTSKPVISNDVANDKRSGGIPDGHPQLKTFLGLPLIYGSELIGIIGIANRMEGYDEKIVDFLQPLLLTCAGAINTINKEQKRKETIRVLSESEAMFRSIIENSPNVFYLYNLDKSFEFVSPQLTNLLGYKVYEVLTDWKRIASGNPINEEGFKKNLRLIQTAQKRTSYELELIHKEGNKIWVEVTETPIMDGDKVVAIVGSFSDITKRKQAELALKESEKRFRTLFDEAPVGYHEIDKEGKITTVNKTELEMLGYGVGEMIGKPIWEFRADKEAKTTILGKLSGKIPPGKAHERTYIKKDGTDLVVLSEDRLILDDEGRIKGLRVTIQDISQLKKIEQEKETLEKQLIQISKLESIGKLAGGIAHDFNNILTVITGYCTLALKELKEGDPLRRYIEQIDKSAKRASELTKRLLAFGRKQIMEVKVVDLNAIIEGIRGMLERLIREDINLKIDTTEDPTLIKADPSQIEQVIINLVTNARDAMPDGGDIIIETSNVYLSEEWTKKHIGVNPGNYVMLSVSDTGIGMTDDVKEKIFEPFFTTKCAGKGTGLGLAMVYGIVKQSGGSIWVYSELAEGTTFKIYFPKVTDAFVQKAKGEVTLSEVKGGNETVLVVEDDEVVRELAVSALRVQGYNVISASNGGEALLICEQATKPIHLIITDVVMPGMSGKVLIDRLKKIFHNLKVIYMSGYTDNAIVHHGVLDEGVVFIQKPFTFETFCKKVRDVLDNR